MNVQIRWKGTERSRAVEEHLVRRLLFAIGRWADRVRRVRASFEDVNGPRGGVDKRCAIEIHGVLGVRRVDVRDTDFYRAIDRAADVASRSMPRARGARRPPRWSRSLALILAP